MEYPSTTSNLNNGYFSDHTSSIGHSPLVGRGKRRDWFPGRGKGGGRRRRRNKGSISNNYVFLLYDPDPLLLSYKPFSISTIIIVVIVNKTTYVCYDTPEV